MIINAKFESALDTPLVSPADLPTVRIRRVDTQALVITDAPTVEQGEGMYTYDFAAVDGLEYVAEVDGDPNVTGQTVHGGRFATGSFSGTTEARIETDIPAILQDTSTDIPAAIALVETEADAATRAAADIAEHDATQSLIAALPVPPTVDAIADQVWAEIVADHSGIPGSTAEALAAAAVSGGMLPNVRQAWTRATTPNSLLRGVLSLELEGLLVVLPGAATLEYTIRDAAGAILNPQVVGVNPNARGYFSVEVDPFVPAAGTVIVVEAVITNGANVYPSNTELSIPEF